MDNLSDKLFDAAQNINSKVAKNYFGETLNLINICTLYYEYLGENNEVFDKLFEGITDLPKGFAADSQIEFILRVSSATLLGKKELKIGNSNELISITGPLEDWKDNPLYYFANQFSIFLFGQYLYRLIEKGNIIEEKHRYAYAYQMAMCIPYMEANYKEKEYALKLYDQYLFGAVICQKLGVDSASNLFFRLFSGGIEDIIDKEPETNFYRYFAQIDPESISFMLYNLHQSNETKYLDKEKIKEFLKKFIEQKEFEDHLFRDDLRRSAIALQAYRNIVDNETRLKIANELGSISEYTMLKDIRDQLSNPFVKNDIYPILKGDNIDLDNNVSLEMIHEYLNGLTNTNIDKIVKHPINTARTKTGNCKALVSLLSYIALNTNKKVKICLYMGREFNPQTNNHVYLEFFDEDQEKYVPIDYGAKIGETNPVVMDINHVIKYPLTSLMKDSLNEIMADLMAKRYMLIKKYKNNQNGD